MQRSYNSTHNSFNNSITRPISRVASNYCSVTNYRVFFLQVHTSDTAAVANTVTSDWDFRAMGG